MLCYIVKLPKLAEPDRTVLICRWHRQIERNNKEVISSAWSNITEKTSQTHWHILNSILYLFWLYSSTRDIEPRKQIDTRIISIIFISIESFFLLSSILYNFCFAIMWNGKGGGGELSQREAIIELGTFAFSSITIAKSLIQWEKYRIGRY